MSDYTGTNAQLAIREGRSLQRTKKIAELIQPGAICYVKHTRISTASNYCVAIPFLTHIATCAKKGVPQIVD